MVSPSPELRERLIDIDLVYKLITRPEPYSADWVGFIWVRRYEDDTTWAVEWEEVDFGDGEHAEEVLEFTDPYLAAECFVELFNAGLGATTIDRIPNPIGPIRAGSEVRIQQI